MSPPNNTRFPLSMRYATPSDIPALATVSVKSMVGNEGALYTWPTRETQDPDVVLRWWIRMWRSMFHTPDEWIIVAEVDTDWEYGGVGKGDGYGDKIEVERKEGGEGEVKEEFKGPGRQAKRDIVGVASWKRTVGKDEGDAVRKVWQRNRGVWLAFERHLQSWDDWYARLTHIDKGFDHARQDARDAASKKATVPEVPAAPFGQAAPAPSSASAPAPSSSTADAKSPKRPHIELTALLISPDYQRRGIASQLVAWGQKCARREGVPIMVKSSRVGEALYERCGFVRAGVIKYVIQGGEGKGDGQGQEQEEQGDGDGEKTKEGMVEAGPRNTILFWVPW